MKSWKIEHAIRPTSVAVLIFSFPEQLPANSRMSPGVVGQKIHRIVAVCSEVHFILKPHWKPMPAGHRFDSEVR